MINRRITVVGHYGMSFLMDVINFPAVGETVEGIGFETEPGGKGYNQAIAASRLGGDVNFITAVGGDDFGAHCDEDLAAEGVNGRYIVTFPEERTAFAFVANSSDKKSEVYVYPGAIRSLAPLNIRKYEDVIKGSALLLLQNEVSLETLCEIIEIAAEHKIDIIYNPAPARKLPREMLRYITCLTPNETEAAILSDSDPNDELALDIALESLHGQGARNVIITLGARGSLISIDGSKKIVRPLDVPVESTTGAGDSYNAALAAKYLDTGNLFEAAIYASVASSLQVMRPGVVANLPYKSEVDKYFKKYKESLIEDYK